MSEVIIKEWINVHAPENDKRAKTDYISTMGIGRDNLIFTTIHGQEYIHYENLFLRYAFNNLNTGNWLTLQKEMAIRVFTPKIAMEHYSAYQIKLQKGLKSVQAQEADVLGKFIDEMKVNKETKFSISKLVDRLVDGHPLKPPPGPSTQGKKRPAENNEQDTERASSGKRGRKPLPW